MNLSEKYPDELILIRDLARANKDWDTCDKIRDYLDTKNIFVFDTKTGQEVYFEVVPKTRAEMENKIKLDIAANKLFDAWLYSMKSQTKN